MLGLLASAGTVAAGASFAKNPAHHLNGHNLLGEKLRQNGKHQVGKIGKETVLADVSNGKVTGMSAGGIVPTKVKTNRKMASLNSANLHFVGYGDVQLAQISDAYYGYCFDDGVDIYYYWYPASDVVVTDVWVEYVAV